MMTVRTEVPADSQAVDKLIKETAHNYSYAEKLRSSGNFIAELSIVLEAENGDICGYILFCEVKAGGSRQLFMGGLHTRQPEDRLLLLAEARKRASMLGFGYIIAFDSTDFLEKNAGYLRSPAFGIFPPDFKNKPEEMKAIKLNDDAAAILDFVEFPDEIGIKNMKPVHTFHSAMTDAEFQHAVYYTRIRGRIVERIFLIILLTACLALYFSRHDAIFIATGALSSYWLSQNVLGPANRTKKIMADYRKYHGDAGMNDYILLFDDYLVVYDTIMTGWYTRHYDKYEIIYLKENYLFLCNYKAHGCYLTYRNMPDKNEIISFFKEKCPSLKTRK